MPLCRRRVTLTSREKVARERCKFLGAYNTRERASERSMRRSLPFSETAISIEQRRGRQGRRRWRQCHISSGRSGIERAVQAQLRQRLAVLWSTEVVRGAIKSVTTSPFAGFASRYGVSSTSISPSELRPFVARRLTLSPIDRPNARHSFIFSRSSSRIRVARLSLRSALSREKFNRCTM